MANTSAAKKALRQTLKRTQLNLAKKKQIKETISAAKDALNESADDAAEKVSIAVKALDKAGKTHTIHQNKAARLKAALQHKLAVVTKK